MAQIVPQANRLREVLVQAESTRHGAGDAAGLQRVGQPGSVVVALRGNEYLRLVFEAPEGLRVDDPVTVALKRGAHHAVRLRLAADRWIRGRRPLPQVLALPGSNPFFERSRRNRGRLARCA